MEHYVRFHNGASPLPSRTNSGGFCHDASSSDPPSPRPIENDYRRYRACSWRMAAQSLWRRISPPAPSYESQYLTLIPLSDARLRPRRTKLLVSSLLLLALLAVAGVFVLVPRGVSVGSIEVHSTRMTFNATTLNYRIVLQADVPIYNPNYLKVSVTGNLTVSFFDAEAGWAAIGPVTLPARLNPSISNQTLSVTVDASNLPRKYTAVVYTQCFNFPRQLIFFLLGTFKASYLGYETQLPKIDTYFMLDCSGASNSYDGSNGMPPVAVAAPLQLQRQHSHVSNGQQPSQQQQLDWHHHQL